MNLNKIELCGFKSFADKTEIVFNTNITGIVGPNGCGKSNVIDAVRWVLGEMAPTTLRVGKMAELIFNGTEKRRSMSYCEVSLYLDNSDRKYDMDYEEVVVTRRLDRSGHSDYLLNRRVCTKSEIVELFRDTGIGKDGYSIIGQGKIDAILASSPEARRKIFEEAAGISSQKAKRIETERMLRDNRSNMERIYDLLSDIGQRLEPLQKAAEAATKARALKNELKFFEISQYLYQNENADAERKKCSDKLRKTDEELFNLQSDYSRVSDEYDSCMQAIKDGDKKLQDLNDEHLNKSLEATRAEGTGKNIARQLEEARDRIVRIGEERARSDAMLNDKSAAIQTKILESEAAKAALEDLKKDLEASQKEYDELNKTIADKDKEIETWRDLYVTKLNQNAEIDKDTAQLATRKEILERDMGSAKDDYKARQSAVAEAEKQKEQLLLRRQELESQHKKAGDDLKEAKANFAAANNELIDLQRRRADLKTELVNVNFAIDNTEKFISDYADYEDSIQNLMSATQSEPGLRNKIIGTVAEIIQIPSKYTTAIGTVLGRAWQNIVTENEYDATDLMRFLRDRRLGRVTFMPLTTMKTNDLPREYQSVLSLEGVEGVASELINYDDRYYSVVSNLLGRTVVVDTQETALKISRRYGYAFRIVTLEGDVFQTSGAMTGGSTADNKKRVFTREADLKKYKAKRDKIQKDISLMNGEIADLEDEVKKLDSAVKFIEARIHKLEVDATSISGEIEKAQADIDFNTQEMEKLFRGNEDKLKQLKEIDIAIKAAEINKKGADTEKVDADSYIAELKAALVGQKEEEREQAAILSDKRVELTKRTSESEALVREIVTLRKDCENLQETIRSLNLEERTKTAETERLKQELARVKISDEDRKAIDALKAAIEQATEEKNALNIKVAELDEEKRSLNDRAAAVRERRAKEDARLQMIDQNLENASARIYENYGYDFDAAKSYIDSLNEEERANYSFEPQKAAQHIGSLRGKIDRIGPINELAEASYTEEKARYEELNSQYEDLLKSENDLNTLIKDLTREMTEKFTVSFNQINKNFGEVFTEIFGGGRARMELEEDKDVLSAGIEIWAEPPGKKLTNLAPLSGGERALTAIAILFAIIKLNPMPFSILDEIDGALDDANAAVFAQYLKKFAQFTQFIIVTHRKPTMSLCDTLFGITMQEMGVSKTVRVKLEEAVKYEEIEKERKRREAADANEVS